MTQTILRVAIALVAFGAGVTASTIYNAIFGPSLTTPRVESVRPAPWKSRSCRSNWRSRSELPPPPPPVVAEPDSPAVPEVPPPAAVKPTFKKRVTVRMPDGTVRVIESGVETVERKL